MMSVSCSKCYHFSFQPSQLQADYVLEIRAHSYQNSDHLERSGACCDYALFSCGYCDNQFVFCLRGSSTSNGNSNGCPLGSYSTQGYIEDDSFTFGSPAFNGVPNPMIFHGNVWPVSRLWYIIQGIIPGII